MDEGNMRAPIYVDVKKRKVTFLLISLVNSIFL
jgi:hypothetical protein